MNWSSVKNLLIAILVAANLFLVYNIIRQDRIRGYIPAQEITGAVELLAERGLTVAQECVPLEKVKGVVYESLYSDEYYTEAAQTLSASEREMLIALPEGGFSITAQNGAVAEFDTEFGFRFTANDKSNEAAYTVITADSFYDTAEKWQALSGSRMKSLEKQAEVFLNSCVSADSDLYGEVTDGYFDPQSGLSYLLAAQRIGGGEIYSHFAVCVFEGESLIGAYGRWYFGDLEEDYSTEIIDQVNILFSDLGELSSRLVRPFSVEIGDTVQTDEEKETNVPLTETSETEELPAVTGMKLCYITYWSADKSALYFMPAWQIDHIDGCITVYNATNGTTYASK